MKNSVDLQNPESLHFQKCIKSPVSSHKLNVEQAERAYICRHANIYTYACEHKHMFINRRDSTYNIIFHWFCLFVCFETAVLATCDFVSGFFEKQWVMTDRAESNLI